MNFTIILEEFQLLPDDKSIIRLYTTREISSQFLQFEDLVNKLKNNPKKYKNELKNLRNALKMIRENGLDEESLKSEKKPYVFALNNTKTARLYCIAACREESDFLILGGGDIKECRRWQDDQKLAKHVLILEQIALQLENIGKPIGNSIPGLLGKYIPLTITL